MYMRLHKAMHAVFVVLVDVGSLFLRVSELLNLAVYITIMHEKRSLYILNTLTARGPILGLVVTTIFVLQ